MRGPYRARFWQPKEIGRRDCVTTGKNVRRLQKLGPVDIDACKTKCEEYSWCQSAEFSTGNQKCVLGVKAGVTMPSAAGWTGYSSVDWWVDKEVTVASGDTAQAASCWKRS